jgi:hypothetical protein
VCIADELNNSEAAEIILDIVYDYRIEQHKSNPLVGTVDDALAQFSAAMVPTKWEVDVLPFLEHLPERLPGSGYKETARQWKQNLMDVVDVPYTLAKNRMTSGDATRTSFVSSNVMFCCMGSKVGMGVGMGMGKG